MWWAWARATDGRSVSASPAEADGRSSRVIVGYSGEVGPAQAERA